MAEVDPRSVIAFLNGKPGKPAIRERVQRALNKLAAEPALVVHP